MKYSEKPLNEHCLQITQSGKRDIFILKVRFIIVCEQWAIKILIKDVITANKFLADNELWIC